MELKNMKTEVKNSLEQFINRLDIKQDQWTWRQVTGNNLVRKEKGMKKNEQN